MKTSEKWFAKPVKIAVIALLMQIINITAFSQCQPYIKVDGNQVNANQIASYGLTLPLWLKPAQYIACDQMVNSISVIEFTENGSSLEYSQVLSITGTSAQTVPAGKIWKVESIVKQPSFGSAGSVSYLQAGSNTFKVPACANYICIEVWGAGGGGGGACSGSGGGGGGGGYGQQCFSVSPGATYNVTVGAGGLGAACGTGTKGGDSGVGALISATGGNGGAVGPSGAGGAGGTSTAYVNISGNIGTNGSACGYNCNPPIQGGYGANGGAGGTGPGVCDGPGGTAGSSPGGGGGAGGHCNNNMPGGSGAPGKVVITW